MIIKSVLSILTCSYEEIIPLFGPYVVLGILKKNFILDNKESAIAGGDEFIGIWSEAFDLLDDIVTMQDGDFKLVKANRAAQNFFGPTVSLLDSYCYELFCGVDGVCLTCPFQNDLQDGQTSCVKIFHEQNGASLEVKSSRIFNSSDGQSYIIHIAKNITKAETTKNSLLETEECFAKAFNANPLPMLVSDLKSGLLLDVNQHCLDFLGYQREEMIGYSIEAIGAWIDANQRDSLLTELWENGSIKDHALQMKTKSGDLRHVLWSAEKITFRGEPVLLSLVYDYTERRKAEKTLQESEEKFALAFDASPDALNINRLEDGEFIEVNQGFLKWSGYTREEIVGKTSKEINLWHDPRDRGKLITKLQETGCCDNVKAKFYVKDGTVTEGLMSARVLLIKNIPHIISITRNMDALKRVERGQDRQKILFETIFNSLTDGVLVTDVNRIIQTANDGVLRTFGYSPQELVGKSAELLYAKREVFDSVGEKLFTVDADKNENLHIAQYKHRSGRLFRGETFGTKLFNSKNEWIGNLGIMRDISERERDQKERLGLKTAIEQANDVVVITDYLGKITYVNPSFEKVTGYAKSEVVGQNPRILKSGQHEKEFYQDFWKTITSGKIFAGQMVNKRKDGTYYTEEVTVSPIVDNLGTIVSYIAIKRDITEQLLLESQLQQAQKMESVGRLTGGVAHDFNNILGVILGYAGMALRNSDPEDKLYNDLTIIYDAASRSAEIVRQLLMFSRQQTVVPQIIDLNAAVEGMLKMLRRLIGEDIELSWKPYPGVLPIKIDPSQVDQILANLCVNARDAIQGTGKLTISTEKRVFDRKISEKQMVVTSGDEYAMLLVSDDGDGIDTKEVDKIFEPFFTTKAVGQGTGLGLSTVYGIVQQNGGNISVSSRKGEGTCFTLSLPVSDAPLSLSKDGGLARVNEGKNETVLLVEDDLTLLEMTRRMLDKTGYNVLPANGGGEALRLARKNDVKIDLLLTDVVMPEMNGKELSEQMQEIIPEIKILFMSGYTSNILGHNGVLDERFHFVSKPFSRKVLSDKIREMLDT